jgi:hypothetical protein
MPLYSTFRSSARWSGHRDRDVLDAADRLHALLQAEAGKSKNPAGLVAEVEEEVG